MAAGPPGHLTTRQPLLIRCLIRKKETGCVYNLGSNLGCDWRIKEEKPMSKKSKIEISIDLADFLADLIEDVIERDQDHLEWLALNPDEPDRDQQRASTASRLELAQRALAQLARS
jgi:hypothetical protein